MMNDTYDIFINIEKEIIFPSYCPVCLLECDTTFQIKANPDGYFGYHKWLLGQTKKYTIPLHKECYQSTKRTLLKRNFLLLGLATIFIPLAIWFDMTKWEAILGLLIVTGPIIFWQIRNPPPIEIVKAGNTVNFTVSSENYATELAALNGVTVK